MPSVYIYRNAPPPARGIDMHACVRPFSLEAGGVWGPAAKRFFTRCVAQADNQDRDVDLYHWSSAKFAATWRDTLSVLVARGRAQVGVHSAKTDWSRRILDFHYMDYDDQAAYHE